jgi:hypothetical protein
MVTFDAGIPIARVAKAAARIDFSLIMRWVMRLKAAIETPAIPLKNRAWNWSHRPGVAIRVTDG